MACCGRTSVNRAYEITYKHDGSKEVVDDLVTAKMKVNQAPQGGAIKPVTKPVQ